MLADLSYSTGCAVAALLRPHSTIQQLGVKTNALLDNAEDLIADMSNTFIQWGERAPEDIQKTSWFQNLQESMGPKLQAARNLTQQPSAQECPATCLDVRVMTGGACSRWGTPGGWGRQQEDSRCEVGHGPSFAVLNVHQLTPQKHVLAQDK
jgi:hypothetical protein